MLNFCFNIDNDELDCDNLYRYLQFSLKNYLEQILNPDFGRKEVYQKEHLITTNLKISSTLQNLLKIKNVVLQKNFYLLLEDDSELVFISYERKLIVKLTYSNELIYCKCTYFSSVQEQFSSFKELILTFNQSKKIENNFIYSFCQITGYPPEIKKIGQIDSIFYPENYSLGISNSYSRLLENLSSSKPNGRLLILEGPPGTGKTHFIRSLISSSANEKTIFILLDYQSASSVSGSELLNTLLRFKQSLSHQKSLTFIIEDADHFLQTRNENNVDVISSLLNLTDGMIGEALDIRVIASTNIPLHNIETALIRPGRLMERLEFGPLETQRVSQIFQRLTGQEKEFEKPLPLCEIYHLAKKKD
jgi:transcriptional regulator of acetoin/glycerol metabolism